MCDLLAPSGEKGNVARSVFLMVAPLDLAYIYIFFFNTLIDTHISRYKLTHSGPANINEQILTNTCY